MNNTYIIKKKNLNTLLDNISSFETKMEMFLEKHDNLEYDLNIKDKEDDLWIVEINIRNKDEQSDTQISEKIIKSRDVL